jgi:putative Mg2+ transporter-C (MgtC) family protein
MTISGQEILSLLLAVIAGGIIGLERELKVKSAGFRTLIFICVGATLFTILSMKIGGQQEITRIAANIVVGIGFLGAGVIIRDGGRVVGITTAATIWLTAALGMSLGSKQYMLALLVTLVSVIVLWIFPVLEKLIHMIREERTYEIVCMCSSDKIKLLNDQFRINGLKIRSFRQIKLGNQMRCVWDVYGSSNSHDTLTQTLFSDPDVKEFHY